MCKSAARRHRTRGQPTRAGDAQAPVHAHGDVRATDQAKHYAVSRWSVAGVDHAEEGCHLGLPEPRSPRLRGIPTRRVWHPVKRTPLPPSEVAHAAIRAHVGMAKATLVRLFEIRPQPV